MTNYKGRNILITGASSGIGKALSLRLMELGATVYGVARSASVLSDMEKNSSGKFVGYAMDITERNRWVSLAKNLPDNLYMVILNAGSCEYMENGKVDSFLVERLFQINFFANVYAAEYLLDRFVHRELKHWVVVSSLPRYLPMPKGEAYGASKAALSYFFSALQISYPSLKCSLVHPGFVETPLTDKNDFPMPMRVDTDYAAMAILKGVAKGKPEISFPFTFSVFMKLMSRLPEYFQLFVVKRLLS